jgi:hypothetical protein
MKNSQDSANVQSLTSGVEGKVRNRITGFTYARVGDYLPHDWNPRKHSLEQKEMARKAINSQGKLDVLKAYKDEDGNWRLFDGHMRRDLDPDEPWIIALTDLTPREAKEAGATFDFIGEMADVDYDILQSILIGWEGDGTDSSDMLDVLMGAHGTQTIMDMLGDMEDTELPASVVTAVQELPPLPMAQPGSSDNGSTGAERGDFYDVSQMPDIPAGQETKRSFILYVTFASEETFIRGLKAIAMNDSRSLQIPGQRFATVDGEQLIEEYEARLIGETAGEEGE